MNISRNHVLDALLQFTSKANGVIVGSPGIGKTWLITRVSETLLKAGTPQLPLPVQELVDATDEEISQLLSIQGDLISRLNERAKTFTPGTVGVLLVDSFDAARDEAARQRVLALIRRAVHDLRGLWHVIVTVRTFDASRSADLLRLFGPPIDGDPAEFRTACIPCRHFVVPLLTEQDLEEARIQDPRLGPLLQSASRDFSGLLRVPFNLWLLEKILDSPRSAIDLTAIRSQVELLAAFWSARIRIQPDAEERQLLLTKIARRLVVDRRLSVRKDEVYEPVLHTSWNRLLSDEILAEPPAASSRVAFAHNILFDFAVSVLLIDDEPEALIAFIGADRSRPLFLRPSLVYYFARLWYSNREAFWRIAWAIVPRGRDELPLVARILPTATMAEEARVLDDILPIVLRVSKDGDEASLAVVLLVRAVRAVGAENRGLWIEFLNRIAPHIKETFAWEVGILLSELYEVIEKQGSPGLDALAGQTARTILAWIWTRRTTPDGRRLDALGANLVLPVVAKTFGTDPSESRRAVEQVLELTREPAFPIEYLARLCDHLDRIWLHDAELAAQTYERVFSYQEKSTAQTSFGGFVLAFASTRRQDYDLCQFQLLELYPRFLEAHPVVAATAAVRALNEFVVANHVIPYLKEGAALSELIAQFPFRGRTATYMTDLSYIWDVTSFPDQPLRMAEAIFARLTSDASAQRNGQVDSFLNIFRDQATVAFWWRRLLQTGARAPKRMAAALLELCLARPVQQGPETVVELGLFIEAAASDFTEEQRRALEESFLALPSEAKDETDVEVLRRYRDRLIARFPSSLLLTDPARELRAAMDREQRVPRNEPLASFETSRGEYSVSEMLQEQGANVGLPENDRLLRLLPDLEAFGSSWMNKNPSVEAIAEIMPKLSTTHAALKEPVAADKPVLTHAWTVLAAAATAIARSVGQIDVGTLASVRQILLESAAHESPEPDPARDASFDSPSWWPAPRFEAAQGLTYLASRDPEPATINMLSALSQDQVPGVRFLVATYLSLISASVPETFWQIAERIAEAEPMRLVVDAMARSLFSVAAKDEARTVEVLQHIVARSFPSAGRPHQLDSPVVDLIAGLSLVRENNWATKWLDAAAASPIEFAGVLNRVTFVALNSYVSPASMAVPGNEVVDRALSWCRLVVSSVRAGIAQMRQKPSGEWTEDDRAKLKEIYGIVDQIVSRVFFAVRPEGGNPSAAPIDERLTLYYTKVRPVLDVVLDFASDQENGILFASTAHHFMEFLNIALPCDPVGVIGMAARVVDVSRPYGYNLDSLAIREVVRLVERVLADFRIEVRDGHAVAELERLLDAFAEVGWPDALRLIWRLEEVFR